MFVQVLAYDQDIGPNGDIEYSIKSGRGKGKFKIHPKTGVVYSQRGFQAGQEYDLVVNTFHFFLFYLCLNTKICLKCNCMRFTLSILLFGAYR